MSQFNATSPAIIFDCDGTLSSIEGVDELARMNHVATQVAELTAQAMNETGLNEALYAKRLDLIQPRKMQLEEVADHYYATCTEGLQPLLQQLRQAAITIYVVSSGLNPSVMLFAERLGIAATHVHAVDLVFDAQGNYQDFDRSSPLIQPRGKREVVDLLKREHDAIAYVGDGMNDIAVIDDVTLFVGFGGHFFRAHLQAQCQHYLTESSFEPLTQLLITQGWLR